MSSSFYKFYIIAAECFAFLSLVFLIFTITERNEEIEKEVNDAVDKKSDISVTYEDYESEKVYTDQGTGYNSLYLTGGAVLSELLAYDGTVIVQINDKVLNEYRTPTGEDVFDYIHQYGVPEGVADMISVARQYEKTYTADQDGKLRKVLYRLR